MGLDLRKGGREFVQAQGEGSVAVAIICSVKREVLLKPLRLEDVVMEVFPAVMGMGPVVLTLDWPHCSMQVSQLPNWFLPLPLHRRVTVFVFCGYEVWCFAIHILPQHTGTRATGEAVVPAIARRIVLLVFAALKIELIESRGENINGLTKQQQQLASVVWVPDISVATARTFLPRLPYISN